MKNKALLFMQFLLLLIFLISCSKRSINSSESDAGLPQDSNIITLQTSKVDSEDTLQEIQVSVLGLKKADCIIIDTPEYNIMIDCGEEDDYDRIKAFLDDRNIDTIDMLLLTHLDRDHIGAAGSIIRDYDITEIYQSANDEGSDEYLDYIDATIEKHIIPKKLIISSDIELGNLSLHVIPGEKMTYEDDNDYSIITEVVYGNVKMLFTGDAEDMRLSEYLSDYSFGKVDFLKVPHHGRYSEGSVNLIDAAAPEFAVITSKEDGADKEITDALSFVGAEFYKTGKSTVEFKTDGVDCSFKKYE